VVELCAQLRDMLQILGRYDGEVKVVSVTIKICVTPSQRDRSTQRFRENADIPPTRKWSKRTTLAGGADV
jgi:hypothetical protein